MMKSEDLKASAKNNTEKDFEFAYFDKPVGVNQENITVYELRTDY